MAEWSVFRAVPYIAVYSLLLGSLSAQPVFDDGLIERLAAQYGPAARNRGLELQELLISLRGESEHNKLEAINKHFNAFDYADDIEQWQAKDYWATPEEFLGTRRGDCEDYVIAKYFALREAGVDENKMFLTYVQATRLNVAHMVLTYFEQPGSVPLVLDNYERRILPATERGDLIPVYSFNARAFFLTNSRAGLAQKLPTGKIRNDKWDRLLRDLRRSNSL